LRAGKVWLTHKSILGKVRWKNAAVAIRVQTVVSPLFGQDLSYVA
jgi:hypothetical protein